MAEVKLAGKPVKTNGELPQEGELAPNIELVNKSLEDVSLEDYKGKRIILNIFPSLDTSTCAASVRKFNTLVNDLDNAVVLAISKDLPFAMDRFCTTEGLDQVIPLSAFRTDDLADKYGIEIIEGPLKGLLARGIVVVDENGKIIYKELVPEITEEPNYEEVIKILT